MLNSKWLPTLIRQNNVPTYVDVSSFKWLYLVMSTKDVPRPPNLVETFEEGLGQVGTYLNSNLYLEFKMINMWFIAKD